MSRRPRAPSAFAAPAAVALAAVLAATLGPAPAAGQEPGGQTADQAMADREARLLEQLDATLAAQNALPERARRTRMGVVTTDLDTFTVGGVRVITPVEDAETVGPWARSTVADFEGRIGALGSAPSHVTPPTLHVDWRPTTTPISYDLGHLRILGFSADETRRQFRNALAQVLARGQPAAVGRWLSGPLGTEAAAHREMAAHPASVVGACHDGDIPACAVALGLAPVDAAPRAVRPDPDTMADGGLARQPLGDGRFAVLSPSARRSFMNHLLRDRPGTLARLLAMGPDAEGSADALLARAAGTGLQPIIADWRSAVLDRRPAVIPGRVAGTTLLWIVLLLGLATRSTRWRAG